MTTVSMGVAGITTAAALNRIDELNQSPGLVEQIKNAARSTYTAVRNAILTDNTEAPPFERVEPQLDAALDGVAARMDAEIAAEVETLRQEVNAGPESGPQPMDELLSRFEVIPPAVASDATPKTGSDPAAAAVQSPPATLEANSSTVVDAKALFEAAGREADGLGFDVEGDDDVLDAEPALKAEAFAPAPAGYDPLVLDRAFAEEDAAALSDDAMRAEMAAALNKESAPSAVKQPAPGVQAQAAYASGAAPVGSTLGMAADAVGGVVGAAVAAPFRALKSMTSSLTAAQRDAAQTARPAIDTRQALTVYNIKGMEKSVAELAEIKAAMLAEPKVGRVLKEIESVARDANKPVSAIIKEMKPGGKYDMMHGDWEQAIKGSEAYARYEAITTDLQRRMNRDQPKLGNTEPELLERYRKSVEAALDESQAVPPKKGVDGQVLPAFSERASSFLDVLKKVVERVREFVSGRAKTQEADGPSPT